MIVSLLFLLLMSGITSPALLDDYLTSASFKLITGDPLKIITLSEKLKEATTPLEPPLLHQLHVARILEELPDINFRLPDQASHNILQALDNMVIGNGDYKQYNFNIHKVILGVEQNTNSTIQHASHSIFLHQQNIINTEINPLCGNFIPGSQIDCQGGLRKHFEVHVDTTDTFSFSRQASNGNFKMSVMVAEHSTVAKYYPPGDYDTLSHVVHVAVEPTGSKLPKISPKPPVMPVTFSVQHPRDASFSSLVCGQLHDSTKWKHGNCNLFFKSQSGTVTCRCKNHGTFAIISQSPVIWTAGYIAVVVFVVVFLVSSIVLLISTFPFKKTIKKSLPKVVGVSESYKRMEHASKTSVCDDKFNLSIPG